MTVDVTLNGDAISLPDDSVLTLKHLVETRLLRADRVAIERNGEIIPRREWESTLLSSGDRIEVVHFVGGGSTSPRNRVSHRSP